MDTHITPFITDFAPCRQTLFVAVLQNAAEGRFAIRIGVFAVDSPLAAIIGAVSQLDFGNAVLRHEQNYTGMNRTCQVPTKTA